MDLVHLSMLTGDDPNTGSDGGAIALGSHEFDLDPVLVVAPVVAKKRREIIQVQYQHIHAAVIVVVPECGAPA